MGGDSDYFTKYSKWNFYQKTNWLLDELCIGFNADSVGLNIIKSETQAVLPIHWADSRGEQMERQRDGQQNKSKGPLSTWLWEQGKIPDRKIPWGYIYIGIGKSKKMLVNVYMMTFVMWDEEVLLIVYI